MSDKQPCRMALALAQVAADYHDASDDEEFVDNFARDIDRELSKARAEENEACARVCLEVQPQSEPDWPADDYSCNEMLDAWGGGVGDGCSWCAAAIRARREG